MSTPLVANVRLCAIGMATGSSCALSPICTRHQKESSEAQKQNRVVGPPTSPAQGKRGEWKKSVTSDEIRKIVNALSMTREVGESRFHTEALFEIAFQLALMNEGKRTITKYACDHCKEIAPCAAWFDGNFKGARCPNCKSSAIARVFEEFWNERDENI
jgi:hypothetical protein